MTLERVTPLKVLFRISVLFMMCLNLNVRFLHAIWLNFYILGRAFRNFARAALVKHKGKLKCSDSAQYLKSQSPGGNNELDGEYSEEEDLARLKNKEWSSELLTDDNQPSNSVQIKVTEFLSASCLLYLISVSILMGWIYAVTNKLKIPLSLKISTIVDCHPKILCKKK